MKTEHSRSYVTLFTTIDGGKRSFFSPKYNFEIASTLNALEMAVTNRNGANLTGTILHSDGGGQYFDKEFLKRTQSLGIVNSMCEYPWENGKAERINGTIKNNYLKHRAINSFSVLVREVDRSVKLYNEIKPHKALKRVSPLTFETMYLH